MNYFSPTHTHRTPPCPHQQHFHPLHMTSGRYVYKSKAFDPHLHVIIQLPHLTMIFHLQSTVTCTNHTTLQTAFQGHHKLHMKRGSMPSSSVHLQDQHKCHTLNAGFFCLLTLPLCKDINWLKVNPTLSTRKSEAMHKGEGTAR